MDNLSVVILSFPNFTRFLESIEPQQGIGSQQRNRSQLAVHNEQMAPMALKHTISPHESQPTIHGPPKHNRRLT